MLKRVLNLKIVGFLMIGCSGVAPTPKKNTYLEYDNTHHVVGDKNTAIKTLIYEQTKNGGLTKKITFHVDKFPYERIFDLCKDETSMFLQSVTMDQNGNKKPIYNKRNIDCMSRIKIDNEAGFGEYELVFLEGFEKIKVDDFDLLLASKSTNKQSGSYIPHNKTEIIDAGHMITNMWQIKD
jgi:hypothetical protein